MSQQTTSIRIDLSEDKQTVKSRSDRAGVVAKLTPSSALFQAEPTLQQSGAKVIAAGTDLAAADNTVLALEAQLAAARKTRDSKAAAFDSVFALYIANAEHLTTPEEAAGLGLAVAAKGNYPLAPPIDVQAHFDARQGDCPRTGEARARNPGLRHRDERRTSRPIGVEATRRLRRAPRAERRGAGHLLDPRRRRPRQQAQRVHEPHRGGREVTRAHSP